MHGIPSWRKGEKMMNLELSQKERSVLVETLDSSLFSLSDEISHTDTFEYRQFLEDRRNVLIKIRDSLQ
jgi:hypothetical protein